MNIVVTPKKKKENSKTGICEGYNFLPDRQAEYSRPVTYNQHPPRKYRRFSAKGGGGNNHTHADIVANSPSMNSSLLLMNSEDSTCSSQTGAGSRQCFQQTRHVDGDGGEKREGKEGIATKEEEDYDDDDERYIDMLWRMNLEEEDSDEYSSTAESNPTIEEMKEKKMKMMMRNLQKIVPGLDREMNTAAILDQSVRYLKFLQNTCGLKL